MYFPPRMKDEMMYKIYSKLPEAMMPLMNKCITYNPAIFHERNEAIDVDFGYAFLSLTFHLN